MEIDFNIVNIVASANLDCELDLYSIAREVDNVEYEPEQFPGAILKLKSPKTSLLLFKNGKLICTGARSEEDVGKAVNRTFEKIKHCVRGKVADKPDIPFEIVNIVAAANLEKELDLYGIAREVDNVEYEPEQFPGAILKLKSPKTSLLLFKNGKLICTGARSEEDVGKALSVAVEAIKDNIKGKAKEKPKEERKLTQVSKTKQEIITPTITFEGKKKPKRKVVAALKEAVAKPKATAVKPVVRAKAPKAKPKAVAAAKTKTKAPTKKPAMKKKAAPRKAKATKKVTAKKTPTKKAVKKKTATSSAKKKPQKKGALSRLLKAVRG